MYFIDTLADQNLYPKLLVDPWKRPDEKLIITGDILQQLIADPETYYSIGNASKRLIDAVWTEDPEDLDQFRRTEEMAFEKDKNYCLSYVGPKDHRLIATVSDWKHQSQFINLGVLLNLNLDRYMIRSRSLKIDREALYSELESYRAYYAKRSLDFHQNRFYRQSITTVECNDPMFQTEQIGFIDIYNHTILMKEGSETSYKVIYWNRGIILTLTPSSNGHGTVAKCRDIADDSEKMMVGLIAGIFKTISMD